MRPADIVEILRGLHFGRGYRHCDGHRLLSIDVEVRDYLVRALQRHHGPL
jgi:hypothetical protein